MRLDAMIAYKLKEKDMITLAKETRGQLTSVDSLRKLQDIQNKNKEQAKIAKNKRYG